MINKTSGFIKNSNIAPVFLKLVWGQDGTTSGQNVGIGFGFICCLIADHSGIVEQSIKGI